MLNDVLKFQPEFCSATLPLECKEMETFEVTSDEHEFNLELDKEFIIRDMDPVSMIFACI